jgi:hypothetical protein
MADLQRACSATRVGLRDGLSADLPSGDSGTVHTVSHAIGGTCVEQWDFLCTSKGAWVNMEENQACY